MFKHMKAMEKQGGNALLMVLVGVALFAALSYTVSRSSSTGSANISKEDLSLQADQILQYAKQLERAVSIIKQNGYSENQISFAHNDLTGYGTYNTSPQTEVFNPRGGGATYRTFPKATSQDWIFSGSTRVQELGGFNETFSGSVCGGGAPNTSCAELIAHLRFISLELCLEINRKLGVEGPDASTPPQDYASVAYAKYTGDLTTVGSIGDNPTRYLWGKKAACFEHGSTAGYSFYYVLLVR